MPSARNMWCFVQLRQASVFPPTILYISQTAILCSCAYSFIIRAAVTVLGLIVRARRRPTYAPGGVVSKKKRFRTGSFQHTQQSAYLHFVNLSQITAAMCLIGSKRNNNQIRMQRRLFFLFFSFVRESNRSSSINAKHMINNTRFARLMCQPFGTI